MDGRRKLRYLSLYDWQRLLLNVTWNLVTDEASFMTLLGSCKYFCVLFQALWWNILWGWVVIWCVGLCSSMTMYWCLTDSWMVYFAALCPWWKIQSTNIFLQQYFWSSGACKKTVRGLQLLDMSMTPFLFPRSWPSLQLLSGSSRKPAQGTLLHSFIQDFVQGRGLWNLCSTIF